VQYAASLLPDCWFSRNLTWTCRGHDSAGRPRSTWDTMIQNFAGIKIHPVVSSDTAMIRNAYSCAALPEQDHLTGMSVYKVLRCFYFYPCPSRAADGQTSLTHSQSCWRVCGHVTGYDYHIMSIENQSSAPTCKK